MQELIVTVIVSADIYKLNFHIHYKRTRKDRKLRKKNASKNLRTDKKGRDMEKKSRLRSNELAHALVQTLKICRVKERTIEIMVWVKLIRTKSKGKPRKIGEDRKKKENSKSIKT